jgi:hypothetical protein
MLKKLNNKLNKNSILPKNFIQILFLIEALFAIISIVK